MGQPLLVLHGVNDLRRAKWAARMGFKAVEVDVALGGRGIPVVGHVSEDEVALSLARHGRFHAHGLPLHSLLEALPRDTILLLDCKTPGACRAAIPVALEMGFDEVYAASRDHRELASLSRVFREAGLLASLDSRVVGLPNYLEAIGAVGATIRALYIDADLVAEMHKAGMLVAAWVVDDPLLARRLSDIGVDMLITSNPCRLTRVRRVAEPLRASII